MSTIKDTLQDVEKLQKEMSKYIKKYPEIKEDKFVQNLFNFTTIFYFNILAHVCLSRIKGVEFDDFFQNEFNKYYSLLNNQDALNEHIRWMNITGIYSLWTIFEVFIDKTSKNKKTKEKIEEKYKNILKNKNIKNSKRQEMMEEFNCIRLTRNSLHQMGIYQWKKRREYKFKGKKYVFEYKKSITPLRILDVANVLWEHYKIIKQL